MLELAARDGRRRPADRRGARSPTSRRTASLLYDKTGEEHYNLISALHKSMRNSDPDARCTGWRAWSRPARTRSTSRGGWCASRRRTSATPIRRRSRSRSPPRTPCTSSACPRATPRWRRRRSTGDRAEEQRRLPRLQRGRRGGARPTSPSRCRCTCATRRRRLMKALDYGKGYKYAHDEPEGVRRHGVPAARARRAAASTSRPTRVRSGDQKRLDELRKTQRRT